MDIGYTQIQPSHDAFFADTVTYTNADIVTRVARCALSEPIVTPDSNCYRSVDALLQDEVDRREQASPEARGKYKPKLTHAAYSHIPRAPFEGTVTIQDKRFTVKNYYFHDSPLNGKHYRDAEGNERVVHHAITSSWDRSSDDLHMAKVLADPETNESICYGSRADTKERAKKQAEEIFRVELRTKKKGIRELADGSYELTYVVNSLTNPIKIQNPTLLNERESLIWEHNALAALKTINVDGMVVRLKPIHVHHTLSVFGELAKILPDDLSGKELEDRINKKGYKALIAYAKTFPDKKIQDAAYQLEHATLSVSERLILVDYLAQMCDLPIVHHCKSIVDRTSIASTVAIMNHFLKEGKFTGIPTDDTGRFAIHKLLEHEQYKKLFISFLNISHQVSRDARVGILPDKTLVGRKALALNLKSGLLAATGAVAFFPERALSKTVLSQNRPTRYALLGTLYLVLPALIITYYALLILATIPLAIYFKKKTTSAQPELLKHIWTLPFQIKWHQIPNLNFNRTFNLDSPDINGDGRHLLCGAKHIREGNARDPRFALLPQHLV